MGGEVGDTACGGVPERDGRGVGGAANAAGEGADGLVLGELKDAVGLEGVALEGYVMRVGVEGCEVEGEWIGLICEQ